MPTLASKPDAEAPAGSHLRTAVLLPRLGWRKAGPLLHPFIQPAFLEGHLCWDTARGGQIEPNARG